MLSKSLNESYRDNFKLAYAMSFAGQLGFYIAILFVVAIAGHNYLDKYILDQYFIPTHHVIHLVIGFVFAFSVGTYSVWQIYKMMKPFLDDK